MISRTNRLGAMLLAFGMFAAGISLRYNAIGGFMFGEILTLIGAILWMSEQKGEADQRDDLLAVAEKLVAARRISEGYLDDVALAMLVEATEMAETAIARVKGEAE